MNRNFVALLIVGLLASSWVGAEALSEVVELTEANFDELTKDGKWLVELHVFHSPFNIRKDSGRFAPWCGYCQRLKPVYEEAAAKIKADTKGALRLGSVDCTVHSRLQERFGVKGYPTIKYLRGDLTSDYTAGRGLSDFVSFANRVTGDPIKAITASNVRELLSQPVAFLLSTSSANTKDMFKTVAKKYQDSITFGATSDPAVVKDLLRQEPSSDTVLIWLNDLEPEVYSGEYTLKALEQWVSSHTLPHLPEISGSNWGSVTAQGKPVVVAVVAGKKSSPDYLSTMKTLSVTHRNDFGFGWLEGAKFQGFVTDNGLPKERWPGFFVIDSAKNIHYEDEKVGTSKESIEAFLQQIKDGKAEAKGPGSSIFSAITIVGRQALRELSNNPWSIALLGVLLFILVAVIAFACTIKDDDISEVTQQTKEKISEGKQD